MTIKGTAELLIQGPEGISSGWLSRVLGRDGLDVSGVERIGTGQMSQSHRVTFTAPEGESSVVVKLASDDEKSRAVGVGMGAYWREVEFYRHLSSRIGGPVPSCHLAEYDAAEGWFTLVLDDVIGAAQGDQIRGCTVAEAAQALGAMASVHAPVFNDLAVGTQDWLNQPNPLSQALLTAVYPGFVERYGHRMDERHVAVAEAFIPRMDVWWADRRAPLGLIHGDFRLDNLLFAGGSCAVVDWQTVTWGPAMMDAAYFLGGALTPDLRRAHEEQLLRGYHEALVTSGVQNFSWEQCWNEYRRQVFWGLTMVVAASMVVGQTERGDDMFMALFERVCEQILDLDSLELLPEPGAKPVPLVPEPADEKLHAPGPEPLWNESFYFDAATADGSMGLYVRLGRLPNRNEAVYTAAIVRAGEPTILIVDAHAPVPSLDDTRQSVAAERFTATQECVDPLKTYRVALSGMGEAFEDSTAPLRGESGKPVEIELDLTWTTAGRPYAWRASTRYEIPCEVVGRVAIDGDAFDVNAVGQRDHSYGSRDWWANDWMWSAFHLEDGTHTHAVTVPQLPGLAIGYSQIGDEITELGSGTSTFEDGPSGEPASATLATEPDGLSLAIAPVAFGSLLMTAPDGRVAHFQRALANVEASDGRRGVGWIEWNRNQSGGA